MDYSDIVIKLEEPRILFTSPDINCNSHSEATHLSKHSENYPLALMSRDSIY